MKTAVETDRAPQAIGPYSQAVDAGSLIFVSGQIPLDASGKLVEGDVGLQTQRCLQNIESILQAAGLELSAVVKTTVFMTDLKKFAAMNEAYAKAFGAPHPARATVEVKALPRGVQVEIEAIAAR